MNHSSGSNSRMFLMELIIAILFFSLASAVCLQMFAASRQMSKETTERNMAMNQAGNAAELLKYAPSPQNPFENLLAQYPYATAASQEIAVYFDKSWTHCTAEHAAYLMQITQFAAEDDRIPYRIAVRNAADSEAAIYSLELKLHAPLQP